MKFAEDGGVVGGVPVAQGWKWCWRRNRPRRNEPSNCGICPRKKIRKAADLASPGTRLFQSLHRDFSLHPRRPNL